MICVDLSDQYTQINQIGKAIHYARQARRDYIQAKDRSIRRQFMIEYTLAMCYDAEGSINIDSTRHYFNACAALIKTYPDSLESFNSFLYKYYYGRSSFSYKVMGYYECIALSNEAHKRHERRYKVELPLTYNTQAKAYAALGPQHTKQADSLFRRSANLYAAEKNPLFQAIVLTNLIHSKVEQNDARAARVVFREARQAYGLYLRQTAQSDADVEQRLRQNEADLLLLEGKLAPAKQAYADLLAYCQKPFPDPAPFRVEAYLGLSRLHEREGNIPLAWQWLDKAVGEALGPKTKIWQQAALPRSLLSALTAKAHFLAKAPTKAPTERRAFAQEALTTYEQAIDLVASLRRGTLLPESRQFLAQKAAPLYEPALTLCYELAQQPGYEAAFRQRAFVLMERQSNGLLADAQLETRLVRQYLPPALQTEFATLNRRLAQLQLLRENGSSELTAELAKTEKSLLEWQHRVDQQHPDYGKALRSVSQLSMTAYADQLVGGELVLCYAPTAKGLLVLTLNQSGSTFRRIPVAPGPLNATIARYRDEVSRDPNIVGAYDERPARTLYKLLLTPVQDRIRQATALSILAPAEWGIPFEALQNPQSGRMLIHDADVVYQFNLSGRLLTTETETATHPALSMAPFGADTIRGGVRLPTGQVLRPLRGSAEESTLLGGLHWLGRKATKGRFLADAPNAQILLLTTHTLPHEHETALVFHPSGPDMNAYLLYPSELQHADFRRVELAALSACATEKGLVRAGDGIHSLGRASMWAGARSVTCSWFPINDDAQAIAGRYFYPNLTNGKTVRENLRQARLAFLASEEGRRYSGHPYYWAGIALYGGHTALSGHASPWQPWAWGLFGCLLGISGWWVIKRKSRLKTNAF